MSLNISDFSLFLSKNCTPPWKRSPQKIETLSSPLFEKLVGGSTSQQRGRGEGGGITHSVQKFIFQKSAIPFLFKNYSLVDVRYLLIKFSKTKSFFRNTKNTDWNGVNKQNTHVPHTKRKITLARLSKWT